MRGGVDQEGAVLGDHGDGAVLTALAHLHDVLTSLSLPCGLHVAGRDRNQLLRGAAGHVTVVDALPVVVEQIARQQIIGAVGHLPSLLDESGPRPRGLLRLLLGGGGHTLGDQVGLGGHLRIILF